MPAEAERSQSSPGFEITNLECRRPAPSLSDSVLPRFSAFFHSLFSLVFPDFCRVCEEPLEKFTRVPVCEACLDGLRGLPARAGVCDGCGLPLVAAGGRCRQCEQGEYEFEQARSFGVYDGSLREVLHLFKYRGMTPLAAPLAARMADVLDHQWGAAGFHALVAVPWLPAGNASEATTRRPCWPAS